MVYNIRGNKLDITDSIRKYIIDKLQRVDKFLNASADVKVIVSSKGKDQKVEVTIWNGKYNVRAEETNEDLYAAIDLVVDKIEKQFNKYKDKITDKRRKKVAIVADYYDEEEIQEVVRRKEIYLKPIDEEEAITQMELLGHSFFVFKNVENNKINVIYKRKYGDYGLIEAN